MKGFARLVDGILIICLAATAGCLQEETGSASGGLFGGGAIIEREPSPPPRAAVWPPQAVWVVRRAYRSPDEIASLMDEIRQAGFNTVLWQVRGNGTAFYRSTIEPLAYEYGGDPGFDPLTVACREAHRRGMALHAWVNVMPGWNDANGRPPQDSNQLYNAHPEWFWYDQRGRRQPIDGFYVSLNPCLPEVRAYLVSVMREIVTRYPVDGLHLDYIRFPMDNNPKGADYPRDRRTVDRFRQATGKTPERGKSAWDAWRAAELTELVRRIRETVRRDQPRVILSAAVGADPARFKRDYFQDGPGWLRAGMLDMVFVMNYAKDTKSFRLRQEAWQRQAPGRYVAAGIGAYMHDNPRTTAEQINLAANWGHGFGVFSDRVLFTNDTAERQRLAAVRAVLNRDGGTTARNHQSNPEPGAAEVGSNEPPRIQNPQSEIRNPKSPPRVSPYGIVP